MDDRIVVIEGNSFSSDATHVMIYSIPEGNPDCEQGIRFAKTPTKFPAAPESICGKLSRKSDKVEVGELISHRRCSCNSPSVVGLNKEGRAFIACVRGNCKFFRWADVALDPPYYALAHNKTLWKTLSPPVYRLFPPDMDLLPEYVVQGSLGDCWYLSALVVLCENRHRLDQVLGDRMGSFRFCRDGIWTEVSVDAEVPVFSSGKKEGIEAFAKAKGNVTFGPLLEKAYACMYGSYAAISGGWISEALFDLTGCPTETLELTENADLDLLWVQLNSWRDSGFLIGCSTSFHIDSGEDDDTGLVTMHAYSVVDTVELFNVRVGRQTKITEFLSGRPADDKQEVIPHLRLVKVRNPWGRKEWTGDWSGKSEKWTRSLIEKIPSYAERDMRGYFWMDLRDFTKAFSEIEIAKTHSGWYSQALRITAQLIWSVSGILRTDCIGPRIFLSSTDNSIKTWCYITLVQPSTRGRVNATYSDFHIAVIDCNDRSVIVSSVGRADRVVTVELLLPPSPEEFEVVVFSLCSEIPANSAVVVRIFSAQPVLTTVSHQGALPVLTSPRFEQMLLQSLPIEQSLRITASVTLAIYSTSGLAVFAITQTPQSEDVGADKCSIKVNVVLSHGKLEVVGRWTHIIDLMSPVAGTAVLGLIVEKQHRVYSDKVRLSGYDYEIDISPVEIASKRARVHSDIIVLD